MSRRTLLFIRWGVFFAACAFLYLRLVVHESNHGALGGWSEAWRRVPSWAIGLAAALMVVNWGLEAEKWRRLVRSVERIRWGKAFEATIVGTSIGLITPNRVGEFAGRVLFLAPENRVSGSFATSVGSIAQFVVTLAVGGLAMWFHPGMVFAGPGSMVIVGLLVFAQLISIAAVAFYFTPRLQRAVFMAVPFLRRYDQASLVLEGFKVRELVGALLFSLVRYAVFTMQYAFILHYAADVPLVTGITRVPMVFLLTTLIPTVMLTELGVRGSVAVALLDPTGYDASGILLASLMVWVLNLAIPALAGSIVLLMARIRSTQDPS